jgi:excisionase family DNA binding protein
MSVVEDAPFMTVDQVAKLIGVAKQTLDNWRSTRRGGPPFVKLSDRAVRYERAAVLRWMAAHTIDPSAKPSAKPNAARTRRRRSA